MSNLTPEQQSEISELSKQGYQLLKEGLTRRAIENFEKIIPLQPDNNYALVGLGDAHRKEGNFKEAGEYYRECLNYHPGNNYALFGLADCYKAMGLINRAIEIWEEYLKQDNKNITVLTRVADSYRKVRKFSESKKFYLHVLKMNPGNSYALIGLGHLHYDFKEYEEALKYWKEMESIVGDRIDIRVLTSIGNCYRKLKLFTEGIPFFERALAIQSGNFYALYGLADCYRGLNKSDESLGFWNKILEKDPENKVILTRAGDAYRNLEQLDDAGSYYRKALDIEYDLYAELGLALIAKAQGNCEEALVVLNRLIRKEPKNARMYMEAAECYEKQAKRGKAIEILEDYRSLGLSSTQIDEYAQALRT